MKVGDLVKVHLLNDLDWYDVIGIFTGHGEGGKHHSRVFVEGKSLLFLTMDIKAIK